MYWESDPLLFAYDTDNELVHIDDVANGAACECTCPSCGQPLIAKNGGTKLVHHFAHKKGACRWAVETTIVLLAQKAITQHGHMRIEGAGYYDPCENIYRYYSPHGELSISAVNLIKVGGRQAPALKISCIDEKDVSCEFALVVEIARRFTDEQLNQLDDLGLDVLSLDLRGVYANMRDTEGRHFSRGEFFANVQDPAFVRSILIEGENEEALRWVIHRRRDSAEQEARGRFAEMLREKQKALMLELEQNIEQARREAEREQVAKRQEAERRKSELRRLLITDEKEAFEREGVEALLKVKHGVNFFVDDCPLLGQADIVADCGGYTWSPDKCIFFEGQRRYFIGCTARQNGIGLEDE